MKRKVLSVIMAILMMSVIITPFTANATRTSIEQVKSPAVKTDTTSDGWNYTLYEDGEVYINGYMGSSTIATLPNSIDGHFVMGYGEQMLSTTTDKKGMTGSKLEKLIIEDGTAIPTDANINYTFAWSENLKEVQIGTKFINIIPNHFLDGCKKLSKVTFSDKFLEQAKAFGKTKFGDECFANCSSLKTFVVPEGIKDVSGSAFQKSSIENFVFQTENTDCYLTSVVSDLKNVVLLKDTSSVSFANEQEVNYPIKFYASKTSKVENNIKVLKEWYPQEYGIEYQPVFVDLATVNIDSMIEAWQNGEKPTEPTTTSTTTTTTTTSTTQPSSTTETKPQVVKATGISLNTDKLALTRYGKDVKEKLTATVTPDETTNKNVKWASSNNKVATVDSNGYVTAKGKGTVRITATTTDGSNLSATCTVTVKQMVTMIVNTMNINRGSKNVNRKLPVMVGNNATNKTLNYRSGNSKVVSVNAKGQITAKKKGTATVSVKTTDGTNIVVYYRVTVKQLVTSVKLNKKAIPLRAKGKAKQKTYTLKATVSKDANNKKVKWTTSNKKVAVVNSKGKVTAKKKGTCYISVTSTDGSRKSAKCKVTVK